MPDPTVRRPVRDWWHLAAGVAALGVLSAVYARVLEVTSPAVVGLSMLLIVLVVGATSTLRATIAVSILAVTAYNYFFLPPVGTFTIEDPENWVALAVFLAVSVVSSRLSLVARRRTDEALARRDELARLFDLSRDILLTTDSREAIDSLPRHMARRFGFDYIGICLPVDDGWRIHGSSDAVQLRRQDLDQAIATARGTLEFDAQTRSYGGHRVVPASAGQPVTLVPLRLGMRAIGLLAAAGRDAEAGTLDALAGLAAIAIERAKLLEDRRDAERVRQVAELKSALLASLGHDLKTPLTAIAVAAGNLGSSPRDTDLQHDQIGIITTEVTRLNRLFQNIIDMARIETGAVAAAREWVHPSDIVEAAVQQVRHALDRHPLEIDADTAAPVQVDPRLTAAALAHLLENAGQYASPESPVTVTARVDEIGLTLSVRDRGPGIDARDMQYLFEQFYRGAGGHSRRFGTGLGLAIARGLLAAEEGRVWAENHPDGGAVFTIAVPAPVQPPEPAP